MRRGVVIPIDAAAGDVHLTLIRGGRAASQPVTPPVTGGGNTGDAYLRPGGTDTYLRPGGTDTYTRP